MSPFGARIVAFGILTLMSGVAINAIYLQHSDTADTAYSTDNLEVSDRDITPPRTPGDATITVGSVDADDSGDQTPAGQQPAPRQTVQYPVRQPPMRRAGRNLIRGIQRELTAKNYQPGSIDGVLGLMTRAAILAYEEDNGLPHTAHADQSLLKHIILGVSLGSGTDRQSETPTREAIYVTKTVQAALLRLGYGSGSASGKQDNRTRSLIKSFERDHGLAPSARISGKLVIELRRKGAFGVRVAGR